MAAVKHSLNANAMVPALAAGFNSRAFACKTSTTVPVRPTGISAPKEGSVLTALISRIPSHVLTAFDEGMKAGFTQFATASAKSGLEPVQAMWNEFAPLNKKRRFELYCSMFGPAVESLGAPKASSTRAAVVESKTEDEVQRLIEAAHELLAQAERIQNERAGVVVDDEPYTGDIEVEPNNFTANVVKSRKLPTKIGRTFTWKGKRGDSKWEVVEVWDDGSIDAVRL